jgi:hypothetical protein
VRLFGAVLPLISAGCSATGLLADAMARSGTVYSSDDDPELVRDAIPFALKTMEGVLVEEPEHEGLLIALAGGFTQYAYAFVREDAEAMARVDIDRSLETQRRALRLFLRARAYAIRALDVRHPRFAERLGAGDALIDMTKDDVPALYWTAASWALAIASAKDQPELLADFPLVEKVARRALELDPTWNGGALHEFFISFEAASPNGSRDRARKHFDEAVALSGGTKVGPYVSLAEGVSVKEQKAAEFRDLIARALAVDVEARPEYRLANTIMQRRAKRLSASSEDLFFEPEE